MSADALPLALVLIVLVLAVVRARRKPDARPIILHGGPKRKLLYPKTAATWRETMTQPENTPFRHATECKMQDAQPEWYPIDNGHYERVCVCRKETSYPPVWRRPDIFDPEVMDHEHHCRIADADREILELAVKVKKESTYDFATCGVCSRNWYAWDAPPQPAKASN